MHLTLTAAFPKSPATDSTQPPASRPKHTLTLRTSAANWQHYQFVCYETDINWYFFFCDSFSPYAAKPAISSTSTSTLHTPSPSVVVRPRGPGPVGLNVLRYQALCKCNCSGRMRCQPFYDYSAGDVLANCIMFDQGNFGCIPWYSRVKREGEGLRMQRRRLKTRLGCRDRLVRRDGWGGRWVQWKRAKAKRV